MSVEIQIVEKRWPREILARVNEIEELLRTHFGISEECELSVLLTNNAEITQLNQEFRNKHQPTNVLSWPAQNIAREKGKWPDFGVLKADKSFADLGDLAFALEVCQAEAEEIGFENHFSHLLIHGYLHLLGFDHIDDDDAKVMEALEIELLSRLNIPNPYERG